MSTGVGLSSWVFDGFWNHIWHFNPDTLPKTNSKSNWQEAFPPQKEGLIFQPSTFRGKLLVSGRVHQLMNPETATHNDGWNLDALRRKNCIWLGFSENSIWE